MCENRGTAGGLRETVRMVRTGPWTEEPGTRLAEWSVYAPFGVENERFAAEGQLNPGQLAWLICEPDK